MARIAWVGILVTDLAAQTWPHVQTRRLDRVLAPSACARFVGEHARALDRTFDRSFSDQPSDTPLGPAVAGRLGLSLVRGYNPLDTARYKEFLALIAYPEVVRRASNGLRNIPFKNHALVDLLGVRYLVEPALPDLRFVRAELGPGHDSRWRKRFEDPPPPRSCSRPAACGSCRPTKCSKTSIRCRAQFVVPQVEQLPGDHEGIVRAMTTTDFRRIALVEEPAATRADQGSGRFRPATIMSLKPNRIELDAEGPGLLVVTDPWFPGWTARVDGRGERVLRADYLFRGVPLAAGRHEVVLEFRPRSYELGRMISLLAVAAVSLITIYPPSGRVRSGPTLLPSDSWSAKRISRIARVARDRTSSPAI